MLDKVMAALALLGFTGFVAVMAWFVREPDLITVIVVCVLMAVYDFYRQLFKRGG
ncbi:MAG: hypothetical protein KTR21_06290 [Rhodobacteraceae bacterium]|nr:hypothetical protein [Paracoccaceae bacterium]